MLTKCSPGSIRLHPRVKSNKQRVADLYIRPGGAVVGEHVHPSIEERFTVIRGQVGFSVDGRKDVAGSGRTKPSEICSIAIRI
jgi:hypothetical protein